MEYRRLARAVRQRRHGRVQYSHAEFDAFEITERGLTAVAMGVEFDRNVTGAFKDHRDQGSRSLWSQEPTDILEADTVGSNRRGFPGFALVVFVGVPGRN